MTITSGDKKLEKSIEQLIARWVIAEKLTFVFWTKKIPQRICVRLKNAETTDEFELELRRQQAASTGSIEFESLTELHKPNIETVSVLI